MTTATTTSRVPLVHEEIVGRLRRKLASQWRTGKRLPPIKQLATELGVGQSNTHRAIKQLAAEGLLASRPGRGTFVCDAPASSTTATRSVDVKQIRLLRTFCNEQMLDRIFDGFMEGLPADLRDKVVVEKARLQKNIQWPEADAVVAINPNDLGAFNLTPRQSLLVIDTAITKGVAATARFDTVLADSAQGSHVAGRWMRNIGCEDVCFVGVRSEAFGGDCPTSRIRHDGFEAGFGKPFADAHKIYVPLYMTDQGALAASRYMAMPDRPAGVFCASDDLAMGFMHGALGHGLRPGVDYQLVGFDGQSRGQDISCGPLSTVAAPAGLMGHTAADLLRSRFENPDQPTRRVMLGCSFIEGVTARGQRSETA